MGTKHVHKGLRYDDGIVRKKDLHLKSALLELAGYPKSKWIVFCEAMLDAGFDVTMYEAVETKSKYITVWDRSRKFKVRFSDHKQSMNREKKSDCNLFVGRSHFSMSINTDQAIEATIKFFRGESNVEQEEGDDGW